VLILLAIVLFLVLPSPWDLILFVVCLLLGVFEVNFWWRRVRGRKVQTGAEALIGARGKVLSDCRPEGEVWVDGARWKARCAAGADAGDPVTVVARDGLVLTVEAR
jgi:membrane-bound serine protease (ClpP class)